MQGGLGVGRDLRGPACEYCRTGSASPYLRNRAAGRRVAGEEPSAHDPGCTSPPATGAQTTLYCQRCGQGRTGNTFRHMLGHMLGLPGYARPWDEQGEWLLRCPRCAAATPHHEATAEDVAEELCLCERCKRRRFWAEQERAAA